MSSPTEAAIAAALAASSRILHASHVSADIEPNVCLNSDHAIEISGMRLVPDRFKAYVEFYLSHAFPVVTIDGTGIHPQVVANSYESMLHQVFDLNHFVKAYNPEQNPRDRILGAIVAVEYPRTPLGGWQVQGDKAKAPAIRCVAAMSKAAEGVDRIIGQHQSGRRKWTVSMENSYYLEDGGFLVKADKLSKNTPKDILDLGWSYLSWDEAPADLRDCYDGDASKIIAPYEGNQVVYLIGGLNGTIAYRGVGLTPLGKEKEAEITTLLASATVDPSEAETEIIAVKDAIAAGLTIAANLKP